MKKISFIFAVIIAVQALCCTMTAGAAETFEKELLPINFEFGLLPNGDAFIINEVNQSGEYFVAEKNGIPVIYNVDENRIVWEMETYSDTEFSENYTFEVNSFSADEEGNIYFVFCVNDRLEQNHELWCVAINSNGDIMARICSEGSGTGCIYVETNSVNPYLARVIVECYNSEYGYKYDYHTFSVREMSFASGFMDWISYIDETGCVTVKGYDTEIVNGELVTVYKYQKLDEYGCISVDSVGRPEPPLFTSNELLYIAKHLTGDFYSFSTNMYLAQFARDKGIINISTGEKLVADPKYSVTYLGNDVFQLQDMTDYSYKYINTQGEEVPKPEETDDQYTYEEPEKDINGVYRYEYYERKTFNNVTGEELFVDQKLRITPAGKNKQILFEFQDNPEKGYDWYLLKPVLTEQQKSQMLFKIDNNYVNVYGQYTYSDVAPIIINSRTMLPARIVAENLGAEVEWNGEERKVIIKKDNIEIILTIDSNIAYYNGVAETLDSPAIIINNRTYTPVRYIAEKLGAMVEWNNDTRTAIITKQ